jgi:hypothetical protein
MVLFYQYGTGTCKKNLEQECTSMNYQFGIRIKKLIFKIISCIVNKLNRSSGHRVPTLPPHFLCVYQRHVEII